jgi:arginyl-tRNA synthetase
MGDASMRHVIQAVAEVLAPAIDASPSDCVAWLEVPPDRSLGDLALPCFRLARERKAAPATIAADLAARVNALLDRTAGAQVPIASVTAMGPYLNLRLQRGWAWAYLQDAMTTDGYFADRELAGQIIAVDLSAPNIAKPFAMGHLRSTVIGTAVCNLLESRGARTERINHLGDWGTQFGKILVAYARWGDIDAVRANPIAELNALYVRFHEQAQAQPALEDEARAAFKRLEDGSEEDLKLWRWMVDVSLAEFNRTYELLGSRFDHNLGESFYNDKMDAVVDELRAKGLLVQSEGAEVVLLDDVDLPPCLIRRSDGATLYATRDLASALYRHRHFHAERLLYVVGGEQRLHFLQLFAVLRKLGYDFAERCEHVAFGLMRLGGKKMSTRKGQIVRLEEVLQEAIARARAIIVEKNPEIAEPDAVARAVGVGAVIFNDLKTHRLHDIDFDLESAVAFDGETGPYVQYAHARACSVLRKAFGVQLASEDSPAVTWSQAPSVIGAAEWALQLELLRFPDVRARAASERDPSLVAKHALDVAQAFNRFYHDCPILPATGDVRPYRLGLTDACRRVLRASLDLLGLGHPEEI